MKLSEQSARTIAVSEERHEIAVGFSDYHIRVLDEQMKVKKDLKAHEISVFTLSYHPHLPLLLSGSRTY